MITTIGSSLLREPFDAVTIGRLTVVRPRALNDRPLLPHEALHSKRQAELGVIRWWWRYWRDVAFRVAEEVLAYRVSIANGLSMEKAVDMLVKYDSNLTRDKARALLS